MDAETLALQLQNQVHEQNQVRMKEIERRLGRVESAQAEQGETLARIEANTDALAETLPSLVERVVTLEKTDSRHRGALGVLSVLWAGLMAWVEIRR